jgi:putative ABC transport system permease protein
MFRLAPGASKAEVRQAVTAVPGVVAYLSTESLHATVCEAFSLYDALVGLMLLFAGVMAAALLYNAMSANVGERTGELGTLQAAGNGRRAARPAGSRREHVLGDRRPSRRADRRRVGCRLVHVTIRNSSLYWDLDMRATTPPLVAAAVLMAALLAQVPALRVIQRDGQSCASGRSRPRPGYRVNSV